MRPWEEQYEIVRPIGEGGMGQVFLARHRRLGRIVALKALSPGVVHDEGLLARFDREGRILKDLVHPSIVRLYDLSLAPPDPFIAMEYVDGQTTLYGALARGEVSRAEAVRWLREMASAIDYLHRLGVAHRDLKPGNVLVTAEGGVKIIDLGLALRPTSDDTRLTKTGAVVGTVAYMAPEQLQSAEVDQKADVYAWGLLACELLAGRLIFSANALAPVPFMHRMSDEFPAPQALAGWVDGPWRGLIRRCLKRDPSQRPEWIEPELDRIVPGPPPGAVDPTGAVPPPANREQTRPAGAGEPTLPVESPVDERPADLVRKPGAEGKRWPRRATGRVERPRHAGPAQRNLVLGALVLLCIVGLVALVRSRTGSETARDVRPSREGPARVISRTLTRGEQGLVLRVELDRPASLEAAFRSGDRAEIRVLDAAAVHLVALGQLAPRDSSLERIAVKNGPVLDLAGPLLEELLTLAKGLESVKWPSVYSGLDRLQGRQRAGPDPDSLLRTALGPSVVSRMADLGPLAGPAFQGDVPARVFTALYSVECMLAFLERRHLQRPAWLADLLPTPYREQVVQPHSELDPRTRMKQGRYIHQSRNPQATNGHETVWASPDSLTWFLEVGEEGGHWDGRVGKEFGLAEAERRTDDKVRWDFRRPQSDLWRKGPGQATLMIYCTDLGESLLAVRLDGGAPIPCCRPHPSGLPGDPSFRLRLRTVPAVLVQPGGPVRVEITCQPYPGLQRTSSFYLTALALKVPSDGHR